MIHLMLSVALGATAPAAVAQVPARAQHAAQRPVPVTSGPAATGQAATGQAAKDPIAEAYFEFINGHRLAGDGDAAGAIAAYRRALALAPSSSTITAALAEVYARQGQMQEAVDLATTALTLDARNWDAHRLLGMIYADLAERGPSGRGGTDAWPLAVDHLEKALADTQPDLSVGIRLMLGRMYLQHLDYDKAIATLRQLLVDHPRLPQGVGLLADTYTAAGRSNEAIALLKDAIEEEPSFYSALGDAYDRQRRYADAAAAYEQALIENPGDSGLKTRWAAALLNLPGTASTEKARDLLLDVTGADPKDGWPIYLLSRAQRLLGDYDDAEATARRLVALSPDSPSGAHALAQVFEARRQYTKIVEALEPAVARLPKGREPDAVLLLTHLGVAYLELGRGADAVGTFERALAMNSGDAALRSYQAQALVQAKQFDRALPLIRQLRADQPGDFRLARIEADALRGQGSFAAGVALLRPLADAEGADPIGTQVLSEYYASDHRYAEAAALLKDALGRFPKDLNVQFQYAAMLERLRKVDEAERILRQVVAADANHAPALNYLGYTLVERGRRLPEALELIKRAVVLDPYNGSYLDSLGWAHFKLNHLDLAEASLREAAEQLVKDSIVQDHFGDVLAAKGRLAEAVDTWRRSLAGDGEGIDRAKIERKIRQAQPRIGKQ